MVGLSRHTVRRAIYLTRGAQKHFDPGTRISGVKGHDKNSLAYEATAILAEEVNLDPVDMACIIGVKRYTSALDDELAADSTSSWIFSMA